MNKERSEELLVNALVYVDAVSRQYSYDFVKATGITSPELEALGFEREYYPLMHKACKE